MFTTALLTGLLTVQAPAPYAAPVDSAAMVAAIRRVILEKVPTPLLDKKVDWDKQRAFDVPKFDPKHPLKIEFEKKWRNDGLWRRVEVEGVNLAENLKVGIENVAVPREGAMRFQVNIQAPVRVDYHQQLWKDGIRLFSGETKARCTVGATLQCELQSELKFRGIFPEVRIVYKVAESKVHYDNLVVEHAFGLGGEAAKLLGATFIETVKQVKPSIERDLLEKANAAILKAGKEREIRFGAGKMLGGIKAPKNSPTAP